MPSNPLFVPEDEDGYNESSNQSPVQCLENDTTTVSNGYNAPSYSPAEIEDYYAPSYGTTLSQDLPVIMEPIADVPHPLSQIDVSLSVPLKFQQQIVQDLVTEDGLLILGRGLGLESITANLIHVLSAPIVQHNKVHKRSLVIVLNAFKDENHKIAEDLRDLSYTDFDIGEERRPFIVLGGDVSTTSKKRREIYQRGGIISISSQIFVVDLLSEIVDPNLITGIVLLHAERCNADSNESFIISLYRQKNSWGFLKALTDHPEALTHGFSPLQTKLKALQLHTAFLWPRFHVEVSSSLKVNLDRRKDLTADQRLRGTLTEIKVKMTDAMRRIQIAILACIEALIAELRRQCPMLVTDYWVKENALDPGFDRQIRHQLSPHWHRLTFTAKQVCADLSTLTAMLDSLLNSDSVAFYQITQEIVQANIKTVAQPNPTQSPWLENEAADTVTSYATKRVFETTRDQFTGTVDGYLLEELPKWEQLALLLDDISSERAQSDGRNPGPTLIMCSSEAVSRQLQAYLSQVRQVDVDSHGNKVFSGRGYMVGRLKQYMGWKESLVSMDELAVTDENREELQVSKTFSKGKTGCTKRRRTRGGSAVAAVERLHRSTAIEPGKQIVTEEVIRQLEESVPESDSEDEVLPFSAVERSAQIIVQRYQNRTDDVVLQELMPSYIVCYEPDLAFLRRIEVYQAINQHSPAKVFFMYYQDSVDEQKHLAKIKKEKDAFTQLIRERATMAQSFATTEDIAKSRVRKSQVMNTRIAGGSTFRDPNNETRVIVDTREFKSPLPNFLHRVGLRVIPRMITVGDYIISPKICLERKAIPDLIQSMSSGRLFDQCKQMSRYYECPTLLIEFEENKSFSLEPFAEQRLTRENRAPSEISARMSKKDIQVKLVTLLIEYPKLKIIWSLSPLQTAEIIMRLKANQPEPDADTALGMGVDSSIRTEDGPPQLNEQVIDLLRTIPGITAANMPAIINNVNNLRELVEMEEPRLAALVGKEAANKVYEFFNKKVC